MTNTTEIGVSLGGLAWPQRSFLSPAQQRPAAALTSTLGPARPADEDEEGLEPGRVQPTGGEWLPQAQQASAPCHSRRWGSEKACSREPAPDTSEDPEACGVAWKTAQTDLL